MSRPRTISDAVILEAARAVFLEHGPAISTQVIADRVGLSQAALFKRFGTKDELLLAALVPDGDPPFLTLIEGGPDKRPVQEQLEEIALAITAHLRVAVPCLATVRASGVELERVLAEFGEPPPARAVRALTVWFDLAQVHGLVRDCDPQSLAMAFLGALHGRPFLLHMSGGWLPESSDGAYIRTLVDVIWRGIAPEEGS